MDYELVNADSLEYLKTLPDASINNIVTNLPDLSETDLEGISKYCIWMREVLDLMFQKTKPTGYIIVFQIDRKKGRKWLDKSVIISNAAHKNRWNCLWHKIVLLDNVPDVSHPGYGHLLCYSKEPKIGYDVLPDVIEGGATLYKYGTPVSAVLLSTSFLRNRPSELDTSSSDDLCGTSTDLSKNWDIMDPFVGRGTIMYILALTGFSVLGVDIDPRQIDFTSELMERPDVHPYIAHYLKAPKIITANPDWSPAQMNILG